MQNDIPSDGNPKSIFVTARDGLRLHVRECGLRTASTLPVVCLPGLTRTVSDFDALAPALASCQHGRRVIAVDSRGRGQPDYDDNPDNYNVATELDDVETILAALGIGPAVFIGSSRGGLLTMLLAVAHPAAIAGAVLHDIGPVIEPKGLARIKSYVGKLPQPRSFTEGAEILRHWFSAQFPKLTAADWLVAAKRAWKIEDGELLPTYDVRLAQTLTEIDIAQPLPPMWAAFDALAHVPVLLIRGVNSDILSLETVAGMKQRHPTMDIIEVPDQGHVPVLAGAGLLDGIVAFVAKCDTAANRTGLDAKSALSDLQAAPAERRGQRWQ